MIMEAQLTMTKAHLLVELNGTDAKFKYSLGRSMEDF